MRLSTLLVVSLFLIHFFCLSSTAKAQCKSIEAEVSVSEQENGLGVITVDLKGLDIKKLSVNLFGPKAKNQLGTQKTDFKELGKGKYLIVIVGKSEDDNYCQFTKEVTIN
jgi:hypothetical protein